MMNLNLICLLLITPYLVHEDMKIFLLLCADRISENTLFQKLTVNLTFSKQLCYTSLHFINNVFSALTKMSVLYNTKKLRSRQRKNYLALLNTLSSSIGTIFLFTAIALHFSSTDFCDKIVFLKHEAMQKKLMKTVENLVSLTESGTNKWDTSLKLMSELPLLLQ